MNSESLFKRNLYWDSESAYFLSGGKRCLEKKKDKVFDLPLVTIVTVVFNGERYLEDTIRSVMSQDYRNLEYIIIDGGSTDGSIDIIKKYEQRIDYWISEKDKGISDAFNKGVLLSSGDYINFQGDGDGFVSDSAVSKVMEKSFTLPLLISGRIRRTNLDGETLFISPHIKKFKKESLLFRMSLPHQGLFTNIKIFEKYGLFDLNNTFCMDYEHLLRAYHEFPEVIMSETVVANWRADGLGEGKIERILEEYDFIKRKHSVAPEVMLNILNQWIVNKYKIKKFLGRV